MSSRPVTRRSAKVLRPSRSFSRAFVPGVVAPTAIAAFAWLAWTRRFTQDDAFISYRYALNLVEGHGLVFNPGERAEGYTNFLWTIVMAGGIQLGVPIILWSYLLGVTCFAGSLCFAYLLARRMVGSSVWGLLAVGMLGMNYSFSAYATGGLETSLQTLTVLLALYLACRAWADPRPLPLAAFSLVAAAALMTRLDSSLLLVAPGVALLWRVARPPAGVPRSHATRWRLALGLTFPALVILSAWFAWKAFYYGQVLPLTFYAKTGGEFTPTVTQGARFLFEYLASYWMFPQLLLLVVFARSLWREPEMRWLAGGCALWWLYVIWIGGDFMEFRFMTPVLPVWTLCVLWVLARRIADRRVRLTMTGACLALALAGSWHHQTTFKYEHGIESVTNLEGHLSVQRWDLIGQSLKRDFRGGDSDVTIAVTAAGAIPFYSGLRAVDMLGLNDAWIARHGLRLKTQPGHERTAPFRYLIERGVNLLIAHPLVVPLDLPIDVSQGIDLRKFRLIDARLEDLPGGARLLEIPIGEGLKVLVLYLVPNSLVETAIRVHRWRSSPLVSRG